MSDPNSKRFAGMAGIAFVVLFLVAVIAFIPSGLPNSGDPASKVVSYFADHRSALLVSAFLQALSAVPFLAFLAAVVGMLRRADGESGGWWLWTALGGAVGTAMVMMAVGLGAMLTYRAASGDGGLARALLDGNTIVFAMSGLPIAVFLFGASQGLTKAGLVGRWVAPLGEAVALLQIVGAAALAKGDGFFSPQGAYSYIAALAFMVWMLCVSVSMIREPAPVAAAHPPATPSPA
jgi:hypothetical protein